MIAFCHSMMANCNTDQISLKTTINAQLKLEKYVGPVATYYAAVHYNAMHNHKLNNDLG